MEQFTQSPQGWWLAEGLQTRQLSERWEGDQSQVLDLQDLPKTVQKQPYGAPLVAQWPANAGEGLVPL